MAGVVVARRASAWGEGEVTLLIKVLDRRDYWLRFRHAHPMEHKRAVLWKVRRLLRSRFGVERSREQIRRKIANLRYKSPQRIENIRRQIRNQRAAARRVLHTSPSEENEASGSQSGRPQQAAPEPSPPSAGGAPSDSNGCADLGQRATPPQANTPSPASSPSSGTPQEGNSQAPCLQEENSQQSQPANTASQPANSITISPVDEDPPSRSLKDSINLLIQHQKNLEREVRVHGQLLQQLVDKLK